jgi:hypothetical protein
MPENKFELIKSELTTSNAKHGEILALVLKELKPEEVERLQRKAAEGQMAIELETLKKAHQFQAASADIDQFINQIKTLEFAMRGKTSSYKATGQFTTATGQTNIEAKKGWCFVATAVYGDPMHPNVVLLQHFRDKHLEPNAAGRLFIRWYYRVGPHLAHSALCRGFCARSIRGFLGLLCRVGKNQMK